METSSHIAVSLQALDFVEKNKADFGIKRVKRLPVSGAFHTPLMQSARQSVKNALKNVELQTPMVFVHSNVTGFRHKQVEIMRDNIARQITFPVKWEQTMHVLYSRKQGQDFPLTYEVGPGRQLGVLLKMTNAKAYEHYYNVDV